MTLVDSHAHLEMEAFDADLPEVLGRACAAGVAFVLAVGNAEPARGSMERALDLCQKHPGLATSVGIHPHEARIASAAWYSRIGDLARESKVWAVGEIGLDYFYDHSPREVQRRVLAEQLELARAAGKPVILHCRDAADDLLGILERHYPPPHGGGVMHCFSGDGALAARCLALGLYISFAGNVTFKKADTLRQAAAVVPADRLLLETDSPYLAPAPRRGTRNEPAQVRRVAEFLAELRGTSLEDLAAATTGNFKKLFGDFPPDAIIGT